MSFATLCGLTALRSLLVAGLALGPGALLARRLRSAEPAAARRLWFFVLLPALVPELVVGYVYARTALWWQAWPAAREAAYLALIFIRTVPVAALLLAFAPRPAVSPAGRHCARLLCARGAWADWFHWLGLGLRNWLRQAGPAAAAVFLIAFHEFEIASRLNATAWTVALFDAHAGGWDLADSLRRTLWPVGLQALVLGPAWLAWRRTSACASADPTPVVAPTRAWRIASTFYLLAALAAGCLFPCGDLAFDARTGFGVVLRHPGLWREVGHSVTFALAASAGAVFVCRVRGPRRGFYVAGLCGPLVIGLVLLAAIQLPALRGLRATPLPLIAGLVLWLLPRAALLELWLRTTAHAAPRHLADLLAASPATPQRAAGRRLQWQLAVRGRWLAAALLGYWAYWDLTLGAILAPVTLPTVPARLYNLMHYGQNSVLSASLLVAWLAPLLVIALSGILVRRL